MKKVRLSQFFVILLALLLVVGMMPGQTLAAGNADPDAAQPVRSFETLTEAAEAGCAVEIPADAEAYVADEILVVLRSGAQPAYQLESVVSDVDGLSQKGQTETDIISSLENGDDVALVSLPDNVTVDQAMVTAANNPNVVFVQPNLIYTPSGTTNDPEGKWQVESVKAPAAWDRQQVNGSVTIAVIDTGVRMTHGDLDDNIWQDQAWDAVNNQLLSTSVAQGLVANNGDGFGHGTFVAGMAAAEANNGSGTVGTSYNARILPIRIGDASLSTAAILRGMDYILSQKDELNIRVVNMSYGGYVPGGENSYQNYTEYRKIVELNNAGILAVASAGNYGDLSAYIDSATGHNYYHMPSDYPEVLAVGATTSSDTIAGFSDHNPHKDIAAPGSSVTSMSHLGDASTRTGSGTSFSSPATAGVAALVFAADPGLTPAEAKSILERTATDCGTAGFDPYYGWGLVNADAAVTEALGSATPAAKVTFDLNYTGSPAAASVSTEPGTALGAKMPSHPARAGYSFAGWNTLADGSGGVFTASTVVAADMTVYAQWTAGKVTVTFEPNYKKAPAALAVSTGQGTSLSTDMPTDPVQTGYTFTGWNTKKNGKGTAFTSATVVSANLTVYAQWTKATSVTNVTVTFKLTNTGNSPTVATVTVPQGTSLGALMPGDPERSGFVFRAWNTKSNGKGTVFTSGTVVTSNMTIYAQWDK